VTTQGVIDVFRRASVLLVAAAFALGGCSRKAKDVPPAQAAAPGRIAATSGGDAATPAAADETAAPASAGPAVDGGSAEAAWNAMASGSDASTATAGTAATAAGKGPFLWKVEGRTPLSPLYLFGTIHVPDDRVLTLAPSVEKAFGEASAVYTEIPMDSATQMGIMGQVMLPEGTQLSDVIGQRLYDRMTAAVDKTLGADHSGMGAMLGPLFQRMKPWAAMSQLSLLEFLPDMMAGKQPLDSMLYARAQSEGKKVGALETPEEQIAVFESFNTREQIRMLELTLDEIERTKPGDRTQTQALIDAYLSGDMTVVSKVMDEAMAGDEALMARFQEVAITRRNNHMTERILALRREQPATVFFVAVGTAHYAGPTGIVAQLQKAGLKVARVP
jgi:uncharacterized protein YbaP (TraB family)